MRHKLSALLFISALFLSCLAKGQSISDSTFKLTDRLSWIGIGHNHNYDDYLSSVLYKGVVIAAGVEQSKLYSSFWPCLAKYEGVRFAVSTADNPAKNANMNQGEIEFFYGSHYIYDVSDDLRLNVGLYSQLDLGIRTLLKNTNNPVNVVANTDLWFSLRGLYRLTVFGRELVLEEHFSTPFCGLMFSPKYTELYYDISYVDNYSGNFVFTSIGSRSQFRNSFSVSLPIKRCTVSLGYVIDRSVCNVNKLEYRNLQSSFQLGLKKKIYVFKGKQSVPNMFISSEF